MHLPRFKTFRCPEVRTGACEKTDHDIDVGNDVDNENDDTTPTPTSQLSPPLSHKQAAGSKKSPLRYPNICAAILYTKEEVYAHLSTSPAHGGHGIGIDNKDSDIIQRKEIKRRARVGRNGQKAFWCGFCQTVIVLPAEKRGLEAWDERFTHVEVEHFRKVRHERPLFGRFLMMLLSTALSSWSLLG